VGSGKTMLCRVLMERLPEHIETIYLANPSLARDEILFAIADELKVELANDRPSRLMRALVEHLIALYAEGRRVVVLIDEAHAMPRETLEEIRLLSNLETSRHKLLQIVLFGQPELDDHLNTADLRQLMERITHGFCIEPLVRGDIERYIDFRYAPRISRL
jgi:type II secretory pathway predicted ATPase ExeA